MCHRCCLCLWDLKHCVMLSSLNIIKNLMGIMSNSSQGDSHCRASNWSRYVSAAPLSSPYPHPPSPTPIPPLSPPSLPESSSPPPPLSPLPVPVSSLLLQACGDFGAWIQSAAGWRGGPDLRGLRWLSSSWRDMAGWRRAQPDGQYHHLTGGQWERLVQHDQRADSGAGAQ